MKPPFRNSWVDTGIIAALAAAAVVLALRYPHELWALLPGPLAVLWAIIRWFVGRVWAEVTARDAGR